MCGHDSHAAMLLGAARILKAHENQLTGTVKLMFQPGEETGAGARLMVEAGVLEHPRPQAAFALHVQSVEETGTACCAFGVNSASLDTFILKIRGRGGHSSQPQLCVDPLMILNQVYGAVNLLAAREADPASMVTLTCGVAKGRNRCQHYSGRSGASHRSAYPGSGGGSPSDPSDPGADPPLCKGLGRRI